MRTRLIIIDAHPLIYRNAYGRGTAHLQTSDGRKSGAFYGFLNSLLSLKDRFKDSHFLVAFDEGYSGRDKLLLNYKNHSRRPDDVQHQLNDIKTFLSSAGIPIFFREGIEADDIISISLNMWLIRHQLNNAFIVSSDRDFFQLVSNKVLLCDDRVKTFYGPKEVKEVSGVTPKQYLWYKCLIGDTSDKIPGIKGFIGKKGHVRAREECVLGVHAVPDEYKHEYRRNYLLIKLPTAFQNIYGISEMVAERYTRDLHNLFQAMEDNEIPFYRARAQFLLNKYECSSIQVDDFIVA